MTAIAVSSLFFVVLLIVLILVGLAIGSLCVWVIFIAWRHIFTPGGESRIEALENKVNELEDVLDTLQDAQNVVTNAQSVAPTERHQGLRYPQVF
jgi:hypothetical protein